MEKSRSTVADWKEAGKGTRRVGKLGGKYNGLTKAVGE